MPLSVSTVRASSVVSTKAMLTMENVGEFLMLQAAQRDKRSAGLRAA